MRQPRSGRWGSLKVVWGTGARETQAVGTMPSPARCKERKERGSPVRMCGRVRHPPGARVVYIWRNQRFPVFLITVFPKNEKENLSMAERNALKKRADSIFETYRG